MTDIGQLCQELYDRIEWQKMPQNLNTVEFQGMLVRALVYGIEDMFVITGRAGSYDNYEYSYEGDPPEISEFSYTLMLDEKMYVLCRAQIYVLSKVRAQYSDMLGYTTNALSVTNADKPYSYLTGTITELEKQASLYYYKMVRFNHLNY